MVKTTLVEAVSPRRLRNTSYHRAPGSADRLAENQLVAPRAARGFPSCSQRFLCARLPQADMSSGSDLEGSSRDMRSNLRITWRQISSVVLSLLVLSAIWIQPARA